MEPSDLQSRLRTSGWLLKKGGKGKLSWKRKFFILDGYALKYFKSPTDATPRGTIALSGSELYTAVHEEFGSRYLEIHVPTWKLKYPLVCENETEYVQWLQTLIYVINMALDGGVPACEDGNGHVLSPFPQAQAEGASSQDLSHVEGIDADAPETGNVSMPAPLSPGLPVSPPPATATGFMTGPVMTGTDTGEPGEERSHARRLLTSMLSATLATARAGECTCMALEDVLSAWTVDENAGWLAAHGLHATAPPAPTTTTLLSGSNGTSAAHMSEALSHLLRLPSPPQVQQGGGGGETTRLNRADSWRSSGSGGQGSPRWEARSEFSPLHALPMASLLAQEEEVPPPPPPPPPSMPKHRSPTGKGGRRTGRAGGPPVPSRVDTGVQWEDPAPSTTLPTTYPSSSSSSSSSGGDAAGGGEGRSVYARAPPREAVVGIRSDPDLPAHVNIRGGGSTAAGPGEAVGGVGGGAGTAGRQAGAGGEARRGSSGTHTAAVPSHTGDASSSAAAAARPSVESYPSARADAAHARAAAAPPAIPVRATKKAQAAAQVGAARRSAREAEEEQGKVPFTARPLPAPLSSSSSLSYSAAAHTLSSLAKARRLSGALHHLPTVTVSLAEEGGGGGKASVRAVPPPSPSASAAASSQLALAMPIIQAEYAYPDFSLAISALSQCCKALWGQYVGSRVAGASVLQPPPPPGHLTCPQLQAMAWDAGLTEGCDVPASGAPLSTAHVEAIYTRLASSSAEAAMHVYAALGAVVSPPPPPPGLTYPQFISALLLAAVLAYGPTPTQRVPAGASLHPSPLRKVHKRHLLPLSLGRPPLPPSSSSLSTTAAPTAVELSALLGGREEEEEDGSLNAQTTRIERLFEGSAAVEGLDGEVDAPEHAREGGQAEGQQLDSGAQPAEVVMPAAPATQGQQAEGGGWNPFDSDSGQPEGDGGVDDAHPDTEGDSLPPPPPVQPVVPTPTPVDLGLGLLHDLADRISSITSPAAPRGQQGTGTGPGGSDGPLRVDDLLQAPPATTSPFPSAMSPADGHDGPRRGVDISLAPWSPSSPPTGTRVPGLKAGRGSKGAMYEEAGEPGLVRRVVASGDRQDRQGGGSTPPPTLAYIASLTGGDTRALSLTPLRTVLQGDKAALRTLFTHYSEGRVSSIPAAIRKGVGVGGQQARVAGAATRGPISASEGWQAQHKAMLASHPASVLLTPSFLLLPDTLRLCHEFDLSPTLIGHSQVVGLYQATAEGVKGVTAADGVTPIRALTLPTFMEFIGRLALAVFSLAGPFLPPPQAGLALLQYMDKSKGREVLAREPMTGALRFAARTAFK